MKNKNRNNSIRALFGGALLIIAVAAHAEDSFFGTAPLVPPAPAGSSANGAGSQTDPGQLNINELKKEAAQSTAPEPDMSPFDDLTSSGSTNNTGKESPEGNQEPKAQANENKKSIHDAKRPKETKNGKEEPASFTLTSPEEEAPIPDNIIEKIRSQSMSPQVVNDEGMQAVEVSLKDISRIVCFTDITRVIYSKEKVIEIKNEGKDAFVKNLPIESVDPSTGRATLKYDKRPKEVYLLCGTKTYSLILVPKDIPATTIYLRSSSGERDNASKFERATDYDNTIFNLIKTVYKQDIPNGYQVTDISALAKSYQQADIVHTKDYTGDMLQVQEYLIFAKSPINIDEVSILEQLKIKNPLAITVVDNLLEANQQTRVIVVRFNNE